MPLLHQIKCPYYINSNAVIRYTQMYLLRHLKYPYYINPNILITSTQTSLLHKHK